MLDETKEEDGPRGSPAPSRNPGRHREPSGRGFAAWNQATTVLRVSVLGAAPFYVLTPQALQRIAKIYWWEESDYQVERVDRQTLPDNVWYDPFLEMFGYD